MIIMVFGNGSAKLLTYPFFSLVRIVNLADAMGVRLHDSLKILNTEGRDPYASRVELTGGKEKDQAGEEKREERARLTGTAVFRKDRLVGWLDRTETRGMLLNF